MTTTKIQNPHLPAGLSQPALRALQAAGITRLEQCTQLSEKQLLALHGLGPKGVVILRSALHAQGLDFAPAEK